MKNSTRKQLEEALELKQQQLLCSEAEVRRLRAEAQLNEPPAREPLLAVLPEVLSTLRTLSARKLRVTPQAAGGFEVEVIETNRLYVSRRELAEMLPLFTANTDRTRYVDELVALGLPHVRATGSNLFNPHRCVEWLEKHFGRGGRAPRAPRAA